MNVGLRYKKSINLGGGFRINLSKSGIGYSWGVPGYRITKTANGRIRKTMSIPGTGLSHVTETSNKHLKSVQNRNTPIITTQEKLHEINSADISAFQGTDYEELISLIQKRVNLNRVSNFLFWGILFINNPIFIILPIISICLKILLKTVLRIDLEYSFEDDTKELYEKQINTWLILNKNCKVWQITHEASVNNKKINAGASRHINRTFFKLTRSTPFYIKTNITPIVFRLRKETLYMLPDKILIIRKNKVGALSYKNLNIKFNETRFIESEYVAKDAKVVDHTWQYVNKNGSPDKRFKNNRQLPICLYGVIYLTSPEGLNVELQVSSLTITNEFEDALNKLKTCN